MAYTRWILPFFAAGGLLACRDKGDAGAAEGGGCEAEAELCDGVDNDCDGSIDEEAGPTWYADGDGDGHGDPGAPLVACAQPEGAAADALDCDDADAGAWSGAAEVCDEADNDCDGEADEGVKSTFYADADGDGYGLAGDSVQACLAPSGYAAASGDCDDADGDSWPGAPEICGDGRANDCAGSLADAAAACPLQGSISLADADAKLVGERADDEAGWAIAGAGDVNGDGLSDLLVGANGHDDGGQDAGAAYVVLGGVSGRLDLADAHARLLGEGPNALAGWSVAGAGDTDGDGLADILVGSLGLNETAGAAYLVLGGASGTVGLGEAHARIAGAGYNTRTGAALAGVGDADGDGRSDLFIGTSNDDTGGEKAGAGYLFRGGVSGDLELADAHAQLVGEGESGFAGYTLAGAGDADGDGLADLLVGAHGLDDFSGAAYLVLGGVSGTLDLADADARFVGEGGSHVGVAVAGAGDADGDGLADLLVGAPLTRVGMDDFGAAYLVLGGASGALDLSASHALLFGPTPSGYAGSSVAGAGDVDGDGLSDLLVGAWGSSAMGEGIGAAYLVLGGVGGSVVLSDAQARLHGEGKDDYTGAAVAGVGDADGDGLADLLVGAWANDEGGEGAGAAYLIGYPL